MLWAAGCDIIVKIIQKTEVTRMNYRKILSAAAVAVLLAAPADAATVILGADDTSVSYVRNADLGITRPLPQQLKGNVIQDGNAYIPRNTRFVIRNMQAIDSRNLQKGDELTFLVDEDFLINEAVVIKKDHPLLGKVTEKGHTKLLIELTETEAENKVPIKIRCRIKEDQKGGIYFPQGHEFVAATLEDTDLKLTLSQLEQFGIYYGMEDIERHL